MQILFCRSSLPPRWRDAWIERYHFFLECESLCLSGGAIARHHLRALTFHYHNFQENGSAESRLKAWRTIHALCEWLCQTEKGGLS
jgi:hypothetical protein